MQKASESVPSGLMSVFVGSDSKLKLAMAGARKWCTERLRLDVPVECQIANYLYAQCQVIGGNKEALEFIEINQKEFNLKRVKHLPVSGAFHTSLMMPVESEMKEILDKTNFETPLIKFYSNYDAKLCMNPKKIKLNLMRQIANPVKWEQIINNLYLNENLPFENDEENSIKLNETRQASRNNQSKDRVYPDIYECGPAGQTGPILKFINRKAYQFYKHIEV
jgi:[acyl-carrier-protein] S-malonyltransferase